MFLPGVGPHRKEILEKELGIKSWADLLEYYPYKYIDRSRIYTISELNADMPFVQIKATILSYEEFEMGPRKKRVVAHVSDKTAVADLVWFSGAQHVYRSYKVGQTFIIFGRPTVYAGRFQFAHPEMDKAEDLQLSQMGMQPYYVTTETMKKRGLTSRAVEKMVRTLLDKLPSTLPETLPPFITQPLHLMSRIEALRGVHYPHTALEMKNARMRLKFEELFYVQLNILRYAADNRRKYRGYIFSNVGERFNTFYHNYLPFPLTGAQKRVMHEIRADMRGGIQMNRLLQGDVGSGKTLVALMTMLLAVDNGYQACIMAPTEILAEQHLTTIRDFLGDMPIRVELLTGIVKGKRRREVLEGLVSGDVKILVGTHAVIEDTVQFANLGLAVVDEQHRFGVAQRLALLNKGDHPDLLAMTATPIPRTLALTVYGDMDLSEIRHLPAGRKPIISSWKTSSEMDQVYALMREQLARGFQIYAVTPLISESATIDLENAEELYKKLAHDFPGQHVVLLHGQMSGEEKEEIMSQFSAGQIDILVATSVIEVGVDVANANMMVIFDADRFGLSQLHQLRGRIGRGQTQSYCVFLADPKTAAGKQRMQIVAATTNGFKLAEEDLKMRGEGDLFGKAQSGLPEFKVGNAVTDYKTLVAAKEVASEIVASDPDLAGDELADLKRVLDYNRLVQARA